MAYPNILHIFPNNKMFGISCLEFFFDNRIIFNEGPLTSIKWEVSMGEISKGGLDKLDSNKALNLKFK